MFMVKQDHLLKNSRDSQQDVVTSHQNASQNIVDSNQSEVVASKKKQTLIRAA